MSADRARDFLTRIEASNVGTETLDQLAGAIEGWPAQRLTPPQ
jgi:hypothetical protein